MVPEVKIILVERKVEKHGTSICRAGDSGSKGQ